MKMTTLLLSVLVLTLSTSCSTTKPKKATVKMKTLGPLDLNATSGPINGYNYYHLPPNAPTMDKKQKTSKNVPAAPVKKTTIKK